MKNWKRLLSLNLVLVMLLTAVSPAHAAEDETPASEPEVTAQEEITPEDAPFPEAELELPEETPAEVDLLEGSILAEGICGDNLTWILTKDGTLTVSGEGGMYSDSSWFEYRDQITAVVLEEGVTSLAPYAFSQCQNLTTVNLPNSLETVGSDAFSYCTALTDVVIPSVALMGYSVFANCGTIEQLALTDCTYSPTHNTFQNTTISELIVVGGCKVALGLNLNSSNLPAESLTYQVDDPNEIVRTWYVGDPSIGETDVKAVVYADGRMVISGRGPICSSPWQGAPILSVTIGDGITYMVSNTFSQCSYLTEVSLPRYLQSIGSYAFYGCSKLRFIDLPESITSIGSLAFYKCGLESICIRNNVKSIGASAFSCCYALEKIYWNAENCSAPSSIFSDVGINSPTGTALIICNAVKKIPEGLFYSSSSNTAPRLTSVSVSENGMLEEIGVNAFYHCTDLAEVELGDHVKTIGDNAFSLCTALETIDLPDSLQSIGYKAFFGTSLTNVTLGRNISFVAPEAFADSKLETITGFAGTYAETYARENGYEFVALENSGDLSDTMSWTYDAKNGTLTFTGNGEILLGDWVRQCQGVTTMVIPAGCTALDADASDYRSLFPQLKSIYFLGAAPELLNEKPFAKHSGTIKVYHLETASGWNAVVWPNCEVHSFINEQVSIVIRSRFPEAQKYTSTTVTAYKGTEIYLSSYADALEQERLSGCKVQGQLAMWTDQKGTGYPGDAALTVTENMTLTAQWDTAYIVVDGKYYNVMTQTSGKGWSITADCYTATSTNATNGILTKTPVVRVYSLYLMDYQGGSIELPNWDHAENSYNNNYYGGSTYSPPTYSTTVNVMGKNTISGHILGNMQLYINLQSSNSSLEVTSSDVCLKAASGITLNVAAAAHATFTATGSARAIDTINFSANANGPITITAQGNVAVQAKSANLSASDVLTISAASSAVQCSVSPNPNLCSLYLAPDAVEPANRYTGGPYLRLEGKTWKLALHPASGKWDDGTTTEITATAPINSGLDLTEYSEKLTRTGYRLTGWTNSDGSEIYEPNGYVRPGEADKLYAVWKQNGITVGGNFYPAGRSASGTGWSYTGSALTLSYAYSTGQIIAVGDITINVNCSSWTGPVGYPALSAYGNVCLNVKNGSRSIAGGSGASALDVYGDLTINSQKELLIEGGDGGCGIDCIGLTLNNTGVVSVVGGINGNAVYARNVKISEIGVTTFVGGASRAIAVSNGDLVTNGELKSYYGEHAASVSRGMNFGAKYLRFEKKSILVNLILDGGSVSEAQLMSMSVDQNADNEIVLDVEEPTKFGHTFQGWQDRTGRIYKAGETYAFPDTQDTLSLQAIWEVMDYAVRKTESSVEITIKDPVPEGSSVLLTSYTEDGKMQKIAFGTYKDGVWTFDTVPDGDWTLFFVDNGYAPTKTQLSIEP